MGSRTLIDNELIRDNGVSVQVGVALLARRSGDVRYDGGDKGGKLALIALEFELKVDGDLVTEDVQAAFTLRVSNSTFTWISSFAGE